jgi:hypothetical protein
VQSTSPHHHATATHTTHSIHTLAPQLHSPLHFSSRTLPAPPAAPKHHRIAYRYRPARLPPACFTRVCNAWCGSTRNVVCVINRPCMLLKLNVGGEARYCSGCVFIRQIVPVGANVLVLSKVEISRELPLLSTHDCIVFAHGLKTYTIVIFLPCQVDMKISVSLVAMVFGSVGVAIASPTMPRTPVLRRDAAGLSRCAVRILLCSGNRSKKLSRYGSLD